MTPALVIIMVSLVAWVLGAAYIGYRSRRFEPMLLFALVFVLSAAFPPPAAGSPETIWNFMRACLSNGVEVLFVWAILETIWVAIFKINDAE
jgi:hypothetical protein